MALSELIGDLPIGFHRNGGEWERVGQSQREAGQGADPVRRLRGQHKGHGERKQRCHQQNGREFTTRSFDDGRVSVTPENEGNQQR